MNPYLIIAFLLALAAAGAGGFKLGSDHEKASEIDKKELIAAAVDEANMASAKAIAALKPKYTTIQNQLEKTIETHTVYSDCKLDAVGVQLVNQALDAGTKPSGDSKLPKADTPTR